MSIATTAVYAAAGFLAAHYGWQIFAATINRHRRSR
mgnify:CR=1 FL=1